MEAFRPLDGCRKFLHIVSAYETTRRHVQTCVYVNLNIHHLEILKFQV